MTAPAIFEARITPHRSLSPRGLRWLLLVLLAFSAGVSSAMWALGAWPVIGFNGAELLVAILLLRRNSRERRAVERIRLTEQGLVIEQDDGRGGQRSVQLDPFWAQAVLEERPGRSPLLLLVSRGARAEAGAWLGEAEKRDLARALQAALHRWRHPRFENAQLTEP